jgi:hypothetical protein
MTKTKLEMFSLILVAVCAPLWECSRDQTKSFLLFPKDDYTIETVMVTTSGGEKKVTFHSYMHIPYVTKPIDKDYQSLNVNVPIEIDGAEIDAANAPIFFDIGVGGYMSVNNATSRMGERTDRDSHISSRRELALAAGYVVVSPGCRGRDNQAADGTFYGKAPAAIVDLKAAVRYIRHNKDVLPGNTDWIVSVGCSAGGAISALLGASGNSNLYDSYLKEIGTADEKDDIYASACFSPIADLDHNDMSYEWMYGTALTQSGKLVDQELSKKLKAEFVEYQESLNLQGENGFGVLTADNYGQYLLHYYLFPSANEYLKILNENERDGYLSMNKWITWDGGSAQFSFTDYLAYVGRLKGLPAFDDFEMKKPEPSLFGNKTTEARHYTNFSLQQATGNENAKIDSDLQTIVNLMNPMFFIGKKNTGCANHWWLRHGAKESGISLTVIANLSVSLKALDKDVNTYLFWDAGHCTDNDPEGLIAWIGAITGYSNESKSKKL